jgi:hypothetical protein
MKIITGRRDSIQLLFSKRMCLVIHEFSPFLNHDILLNIFLDMALQTCVGQMYFMNLNPLLQPKHTKLPS